MRYDMTDYMAEPNQLPVVGGPLDGQTQPWRCTRHLVVPDRDGSHTVVADDGHSVTLFSRHAYELVKYAGGGEVAYRWEYRGLAI